MAEIGETGVRGLWKKLTGQATREEAARDARALELQKAEEAEKRRAASAVTMNFRLKRESAYKLLDLVRIEPEAAEIFLQTAAKGFEADEPNSPTVGIPRVKSDEVVIVNFDRFKSDLVSRMPYSGYKIAQEMLQNKDGQVEIYKYSAPHGVADPNRIP